MKSQPNSDFDPDLVAAANKLVGLYIKARPRRFRAFIDHLMDRLGLTLEQAQPYARNAYTQIRGDLELNGDDVADMDNDSRVIAEVRRMRAAEEARESVLTRYGDGELTAKERDMAIEALDYEISQEAIRSITTARRTILDRYDDGELTAAERNAEMDVLDNEIVQLATRAAKKARDTLLIRYDDGELTAAERDAELGALDSRLVLSIRAMPDDTMAVSLDGLLRLEAAAAEFAKAEATRIVRAVIEDMRDRPAQGTFGEVAARHMWDEYCWALQEGPFDDDEGWDDVRLGSLSGAFDEMVRMLIEVEIDRLPHHAQVFLSSKAIDDDFDMEEDALGSVWMHGMVNLVLEELNSQASCRSLYLIGPDRASVIGSEVEGSGMVWSVLSDRREATDIVASHVNEMIDPKGDLSLLAEEMVDAFIAAAKEEVDETVAAEFFDKFEDQIREMLTENDVLPALEDMRAQLQEQMDS